MPTQKLKPPQEGWQVLGRELEEAFGPGFLASHGRDLAYFVLGRGDPYSLVLWRWEKYSVRIYWLGASSWRPQPLNGWILLWSSGEGLKSQSQSHGKNTQKSV